MGIGMCTGGFSRMVPNLDKNLSRYGKIMVSPAIHQTSKNMPRKCLLLLPYLRLQNSATSSVFFFTLILPKGLENGYWFFRSLS